MRRFLLPALALLAVAAFFFEYLPPVERVHIFSDLEVYHFPLQRYAFDALHSGRLPQWDPSMYCGISYAGNPQAALFYPPMWLLYGLNLGRAELPFQALQIFAIAHVWLAFVLCWLWLRNRRLDPLACGFGASVFAFGGYLMWQIVHLGVLMAVPWMPLAFLGIDQFAERGDWRPLWKTAAASALWFLAGYPPSWAAFCVTLVIYAMARRAVLAALGSIAVSVLLAMVQILPALEAGTGIFEQARYTSTTGSPLAALFVANWIDANQNAPHHYLECLYVYWGLPAIFALVYLAVRREWRPYTHGAVTLAACLFLVLDPGHLVYYAIVHVPLLERTLQSYNFYEGAAAMAALLTAAGLHAFLKRSSTAPRWAAPATVAALVGWTVFQFTRHGNFPSGWTAAAETAVALALFAVTAWTRRRWALAALLLFTLADYQIYGTNRLFNARPGNVDELYPPHAIRGISDEAYRALMANRQYRVTSDGSPSAMEFRIFGLASPQGLDPLLSARYRALMEQWGATFETTRVFHVNYRNRDMLETLGVRYAISYNGGPNEALLAADPDFRRIGPESFYHVYEYVHAQPAYHWGGGVHPTVWLPEQRTFHVQSAAGGPFVLAEQMFPGWHATVDGREVPISLWGGVFQAIDVPAGDHRLTFEYRSRRLPLGAAISLAALLGLAIATASRSPWSRTSSSPPRAGRR